MPWTVFSSAPISQDMDPLLEAVLQNQTLANTMLQSLQQLNVQLSTKYQKLRLLTRHLNVPKEEEEN